MSFISAFDVIGPDMIGPSSSHTAGACSIGLLARKMLKKPPARVRFELYGSFAKTGKGHGTDRALLGGVMGFQTDDRRLPRSYEIAEESGLKYEFIFNTTKEDIYPNTVDIDLETEDGEKLYVRGESLGGGKVRISRINGVEVDLSGEYSTLIVIQRDKPGVVAHITKCLSDLNVNIAFMRLYREARGETAYSIVESDGRLPEEVTEHIRENRYVRDVMLIQSDDEAIHKNENTANKNAADEDDNKAIDFKNGAELLKLCRDMNISISEAMRLREQSLSDMDSTSLNERMQRKLDIMKEAAKQPLERPVPSIGGLIGGEAKRIYEHGASKKSICGDVVSRAITYAMAVLEINASMGLIVAAPTAGSAGVVPGVLLSLQEQFELSDEDVTDALFNAAAIGYLAMRNATVAGAVGGCQAEVGIAAAMAASAAAELMGGSAETALNAASIVLMDMLGLVCDPIGGLVECPCQQRNAAGAAVALTASEIALSGVRALIPFDEMLQAMYQVGRKLPSELRETALGGCAATPTGSCLLCSRK